MKVILNSLEYILFKVVVVVNVQYQGFRMLS